MSTFPKCKNCSLNYDHNERIPFVLVPCAHTFCMSCLSKIKSSKCPNCDTKIINKSINLDLFDLIPKSNTETNEPRSILAKTKELENSYKKNFEEFLEKINTEIKSNSVLLDSNSLTDEQTNSIVQNLNNINSTLQNNLNLIQSLEWNFGSTTPFLIQENTNSSFLSESLSIYMHQSKSNHELNLECKNYCRNKKNFKLKKCSDVLLIKNIDDTTLNEIKNFWIENDIFSEELVNKLFENSYESPKAFKTKDLVAKNKSIFPKFKLCTDDSWKSHTEGGEKFSADVIFTCQNIHLNPDYLLRVGYILFFKEPVYERF